MSYNDQAIKIMLKKANEKYLSASDDYKSGRYDSCIGNLYYAAYQTVTAYMISKGQLAKKHTHVRAFVNKELARKGLITREAAKVYNQLMDDRSDADYNFDIIFDRTDAKVMMEGVKAFCDEI